MTGLPETLVDELDADMLAEVFADGEMNGEGWKMLDGAEPRVRRMFYRRITEIIGLAGLDPVEYAEQLDDYGIDADSWHPESTVLGLHLTPALTARVKEELEIIKKNETF